MSTVEILEEGVGQRVVKGAVTFCSSLSGEKNLVDVSSWVGWLKRGHLSHN